MHLSALTTTGTYSKQEISLFEKEVNVRQVLKNEILQRRGETAKCLYFVLTGAVYQYDDEIAEKNNIIDLYTAGDWVVNHHSFISQLPSKTTIASFTECTLVEITIDSIHHLIARSSSFLQLNRIMDRAYSRSLYFDYSYTPSQKYKLLLERKPGLVREFPLKMIASFLKITPETLSRVRANLVRSSIKS